MAEVTGLRNNALPYPVYGAPYGVIVPILDADGDFVTGAASLDSEVSQNGDTFADCTNEATEIGSTGLYYLLLTATEMTSDVVTVQVKTGTAGAKTTPIVLYPRKLVTLRSGTAAGGASGSITLDSGASDKDDFYNGCLVVGTLDSAVEARVISDYTGSSKVAAVVPDWNTTPDSDDTFIVKLTEGIQINQANVTLIEGVDATDQIRDSVVDDATRIDASALNTLSGHDPGETIMGATDLGTGAGLTTLATQASVDDVESKVDDLETRLGTPSDLGSGATVSANLVDIEGQTDDIGAAGAGLTALATAAELAKVPKSDGTSSWNATALAAIQSEANDALVANHLDHLLAVTYDPASQPGVADALFNELIESDAGVSRYTANALEQAPTGGSAPTAAAIADAVWDEAQADHVSAGSFGEVATETAAILVDTAEIGAAGAGLTNINLPNQTMDITGNITGNLSGSVGSVTSGVSLADDAITAGKFDESTAFPLKQADASTTAVARVGADSDTLETLSDQIDLAATAASLATVATYVDTEVAAIKAKTDQLTFTVANTVDSNVSAINGTTTGVDKLSAHLPAVLKVVVGTGSTTTEVVLNATTGINGGAPSATNDFYNGRVIVFTSGTLAGQATDITDYVGSTVTLTVTALTGAPSAADTAVIV